MTWGVGPGALGRQCATRRRAALHAKTGAFVMRTSASDGPADNSATRRKKPACGERAEAESPSSGFLDFDLLRSFLCFCSLRQGHRQDAFLQAGLHLVGVDAIGESEATPERSKLALAQIVALLLLFSFRLAFALDPKRAVQDLDLNALVIKARHVRRHLVGVILLGDIDCGSVASRQLTAEHGISRQRAAEG